MPNWEQVEPYLRKLAESLGVAADQLWQVLVQAQRIAGYQDLVWVVLWLLGIVVPIMVFRIIMAYNRAQDEKSSYYQWDGSDYQAFAWSLLMVGALLVGIGVVVQLNSAIMHLVLPEYGAIKEILRVLSR